MDRRLTAAALVALAAGPPLGGFGQGPDAAIRAAAIRAVVGPAVRLPLLVVPDGSADTTLARRVAARLGGQACGAAAGRTCRGDAFPRCAWSAGGDTVAVRARVDSTTASGASVVVDTWGALRGLGPSGPRNFYEQWRIVLARRGGGWVVVERIPLWAT